MLPVSGADQCIWNQSDDLKTRRAHGGVGGVGGEEKKGKNVKKKKEITTLIDAAGRHMRRHMEKLPQRAAIIDSLQRCSLLGTFTNKGRPINVSHADQAGNWECVCVCVGATDEVREERQEACVLFRLALPFN